MAIKTAMKPAKVDPIVDPVPAKENPLATKAVLASVNITQWMGYKFDRAVTEKVNADYHAKSDAGRYNKRLIAKDHIKKVQNAAIAARGLHYQLTQPWLDDGQRIRSCLQQHQREVEVTPC